MIKSLNQDLKVAELTGAMNSPLIDLRNRFKRIKRFKLSFDLIYGN